LYTQYNNYQVPRIKGTFLLHQLRLLLGNDRFSRTMNAVHDHYRESEMSNSDFITTVENSSDEKLKSFILQWLERDDLPQIIINAEIDSIGDKWQIMLDVSQSGRPWHFLTSVKIVMERESIFHIIEVDDAHKSFTFDTESKPLELVFNALNDIPENHENYFTWANFFDDFHHTKIVYGTKRQIEANHTLALRMSTMLADRYTEELKPVIKDSEISAQDLAENDLIVIGGISENNLMQNLADSLNLLQGKNMFVWRGKKYVRSDDGCFISLPSPFNKEKVVYLFNSNSAMQLYHMTKEWKRIPSWAVYKGDEIVEKGFHENPAFKIKF
jgi:hypothetical protein